MSKKIVAIGGGVNRFKDDGSVYELENIDSEIVKLASKVHPNFLLLSHAQPIEKQESYFTAMEYIYGNMFGCNCKTLLSTELIDQNKVNELINWADIIYEAGGDSLAMLNIWKETGFDKVLRQAWEQGKVLCGLSAGAVCWFKSFNTDSIVYEGQDSFVELPGLDFIDAYFVPHANYEDRLKTSKEHLLSNNQVGILVSNGAALEIVDNSYCVLAADDTKYGDKIFVSKNYWDGDEYHEEILDNSRELKPLDSILTRAPRRKK